MLQASSILAASSRDAKDRSSPVPQALSVRFQTLGTASCQAQGSVPCLANSMAPLPALDSQLQGLTLATTVQPAARAGALHQVSMSRGKLKAAAHS